MAGIAATIALERRLSPEMQGSPTLDLLEAEVHAFGRSTGATRDVRGLALHALAADMLVTIAELGPRALRGYGDLDDGATELLVRETAKLRELGSRLADELTHRGGAT